MARLNEVFGISETPGSDMGVPNEIRRILDECKRAGCVGPGTEGTIYSALVDAWSWGKFGRRGKDTGTRKSTDF
jgi:hypothetical protein